jgi:hypothetical protein
VSSLLIRDVPDGDLQVLRAAAAARGQSLQAYMLGAVHDRALYARRQEALGDISRRLEGQPLIPAPEREAVLDAVDAAHDERADDLARDR